MPGKVLVDSSAWTHVIRKNGRADVRERVEKLLFADQVVWCDIVRLELWAGVKGERERNILRQFDSQLPSVPITSAIWANSFRLVNLALLRGYHIAAHDFLIYSCAQLHGLQIEHLDGHYDLLGKIEPL